MIGDVAAAVGVVERDTGARQDFGARQQVVEMAVAAERDDVRMLDDHEVIGNLAALALFREVLLNRQGFGVRYQAEIEKFAKPCVGTSADAAGKSACATGSKNIRH